MRAADSSAHAYNELIPAALRKVLCPLGRLVRALPRGT
jgi:hypothetical protein